MYRKQIGKIKILLIGCCILKTVLHLIADHHSGFQGDELLHIEAGHHLAWGYMEFPPMIGWLARLQNIFHSDAVYIQHILPHISAIIIIIYLTKIVVRFGGSEPAVLLVLLGFLIAPGFYRSEQLFQPVVFSQLFWVLAFYQLTSFISTLERKHLWYLTLFCVLGFLTKYDAVFFLFGLAALLLFDRTRRALIDHKAWVNIAVFLLCITPNLLWQYDHHFPALQMFGRLKETQLDALTRWDILKDIFISINPLTTLLLGVPAIVYFFKSKNRILYPVGLSIGLSFLLLLIKNGKAYYFYPLLITLLPFGGLFWEHYVFPYKKWAIYPLVILLVTGMVLIPFGMPVYSFDRYLERIYPYEKKEITGGKYAVRFDEYYSREKWRMTLSAIKAVYDSLPENDRKEALIWGKHYSQAGIVKLERKKYNLPDVFSFHGSFYTWAPDAGKMPATVIAFRESRPEGKDFFEPYFDHVIPVRTIYNPYARENDELYQTIFICKDPLQDFPHLKNEFTHRIFE